MASESVENYLKAIYKLERAGEWAATSQIAERLGVSPPSVSRMIRRLSESDWVEHEPYRGVRLTEAGRRQALRIIRNHRILETYLADVLGMSWDRVDDEVERLEHVVSDELINRMEEALDFPAHDPHGSPIPDRDGNMPATDGSVPLTELEVGDRGVVSRIAEAPPEALSYLEERNLVLGTAVEVMGREPLGGSVALLVGTRETSIGVELARRIHIRAK